MRFRSLSLVVLLLASSLASAAPQLQTHLFTRRAEATVGSRRFAVIGDAGTGRKRQRAVIARMLADHDERPFETVLMLGDNIYDDGPLERFDSAIGKPFSPLLQRGVRLYGILGNHDVQFQRGEAQLRYLGLGLGKKRWYKTAVADGDVEVFAIDTTLLVTDRWTYHGEARWKQTQADAQLAWLDKTLASGTAKFKLVMGHHPLYSSGTRGTERREMREQLDGMLAEHGVDAYLAGHQHVYERHEPRRGVVHFVSGADGRDPGSTVDPVGCRVCTTRRTSS